MAGSSPTNDWRIPGREAIPRLVELHGGRLCGLGRRLCRSDMDLAHDLYEQIGHEELPAEVWSLLLGGLAR